MLRLVVRLLIWFILFALVSWFVAQWKLKQDVENFQRLVSPIADFRYEGVSVNVFGELKIRNIEITPHGSGASWEVGELVASTGSLWSLLMAKLNIEKREFPKESWLRFSNVMVPFSQLAQDIDSEEEDASWEILSALECGPIKRIGARQIVQMGVAWISLSGEIRANFSPRSGVLTLSGYLDQDELDRREFQINIGGFARWLEAQEKLAPGKERPLPRIDYARLKIEDNGFNDKANQFCAIKSERSVEGYLAAHLDAVKTHLAEVGLHPTDEALKAYLAYRQPGSRFEVVLQPQGAFEWDSLSYYNMQELEEIAGLQIKINDQVVKHPIPDWSWNAFLKLAQVRQQKKRQEAATARQYESKVIKRSYQPRALSQVSLEKGMRVRITRRDGHQFSGRIARFDQQTIWLNVKRGSGVLTMPIRRSQIKTFEVYQ